MTVTKDGITQEVTADTLDIWLRAGWTLVKPKSGK